MTTARPLNEQYPCNCDLPPNLERVGALLTMCHHTPASAVRADLDIIVSTLARWEHLPKAGQMMNEPLSVLFRRYTDSAVGSDHAPTITEPERKALTIAFLRQAAMQYLAIMAGVIEEFNNPDPDADPAGAPKDTPESETE